MNYFTFRFSSLLLAVLLLGGIAKAQLSGTITVPTNPKFPDLKAVVDSLNLYGVSGAVTINVTGNQTAPITGYVLGGSTSKLNSGTTATSATRTITINGNGNTVISQVGYGDWDGVVKIMGVDYITIDRLNIQENASNSGTIQQMEYGYLLVKRNGGATPPYDGAQRNTIKNCTIGFVSGTTTLTYVANGIAMLNSDTTTTAPVYGATAVVTDANSYNTFSGNTITNCIRGVYLTGMPSAQFSNATTSVMDVNNVVSGNNISLTIGGGSAYGVFTSFDSTVTITGNTIQTPPTGFNAGAYGVEVQVGRGDVTINQNTIALNSISASATLFGIHLANTRAELKGKLNINGNLLSDWNHGAAGNGATMNIIYNQGAGFDSVNIRNNTISGILYGAVGTFTNALNVIYNDVPGTSATGIMMSGNTIKNITKPSSNGDIVLLFNRANGSAAAPGVISVLNNTVSNITTLTNVNGVILFSGNASRSFSVKGNKIDGVTMTGTGSFQGFYSTATPVNDCELANDTVMNITTNSGTISPVYNNQIGNMQMHHCFITKLRSTSGAIYGYRNGAGGTITVHSNMFTDFGNTGTSGAIYGINSTPNFNLCTFNAYNNFVSGFSIGTNYSVANNIFGAFFQNQGTVTFYNNTIKIDALTTAGTDLGATGIFYDANVLGLDLRNNIVNVNVTPKGSGYTVALRRSSGTALTIPSNLGATSNGNIYYVPAATNSHIYGEGSSAAGLVNTFNITSDPSFNTPCGLYKKFLVTAEQGSYYENNLVAGTLPGTFIPTGSSYAKNAAVTTTTPAVTLDYAGTTRPVPADAGALQFTGTAAGAAAPSVAYRPLATTAYCTGTTGGPSIVANITAVNGLNMTTGTAPRLYYKKSGDANAFGNYPTDNTSSFNGWKYVEGTGFAPTISFAIDYSKLRSAVAVGDSITYFIIAQDNTPGIPNVTANLASFPSTYCPSGVNLTAAAGPLTSVAQSYGYKIIAPIFAAQVLHNGSICTGTKNTVSVSPVPPTGTTYVWQQDNGSGFVNVNPSATGSTYTTPNLTAGVTYRAALSLCGGTINTNTSSATVTVITPAITSTVADLHCGAGIDTLVATGAVGTTFKWYDAATGGNLLRTDDTLITPFLNMTTVFYVSASSGNGGETVPSPAGPYLRSDPNNWVNQGFGAQGEFFTVNKTVTINSVKMYLSSPSSDVLNISIWINDLINGGPALMGQNVTIKLDTSVGEYIIPVNFQLQPGQYRMSLASGVGRYSSAYTTTATYPYNSANGAITITGGGSTTPNQANYYHFFDWSVSAPCESPRTAVTATIDSVIAVITPPSATTYCQGDSMRLFAATNLTYTYQWLASDTVLPNATASFYTTKVAGDYRVLIANANCSDTSDAITIKVNPLPTPVITATGAHNENLTTGVYKTYQWNKNGFPIFNAIGKAYTVVDSGSYTVTVTDTNDCPATSAAIVVDPTPPNGIASVYGNSNNVRIYPNPAVNTLNISAPFAVNVTVSGMDGKELLRQVNAAKVDVSNLANGIYMVKITDQNGIVVKVEKIVKSNL